AGSARTSTTSISLCSCLCRRPPPGSTLFPYTTLFRSWGELCPECRAERQGRASRLAHRISLAATALMAAYVAFRFPGDSTSRLYGAVAVLATYIIVRRVASRAAMEFLPK